MVVKSVEIEGEVWREIIARRNSRTLTSGDPGYWEDNAGYDLYGPIACPESPLVLAQVGQSLDGRVATPAGDARDVSGKDGLAHLHRCRALVDAVIVGEGTVSADNPRLSVRLAEGPDPVRVVIDSHGRLTGQEGLFNDGGTAVIVFQSTEVAHRQLGDAEIVPLSPCASGLDPEEILRELRQRNLACILIEGGARTISRFVDAGAVDRLHVAISPMIIGSGPSGMHLPPIERLADAYRPDARVYNLGSDILFDCILKPTSRHIGRVKKVYRLD